MKTLISKISSWYFSKSTLPYWCILVIDWIILMFVGIFSHYIIVGGSRFVCSFWNYIAGLLLLSVIYIIFFRVRRTYTGVLRFSGFVDLSRIASAVTLAFLLGFLCYLLDAHYSHLSDQLHILLPSIKDQVVIAVGTTLLMWLERIIVKTLYDEMRSSSSSFRTFIYGVQDGGVSLAKSIRSQNPIVYYLRGFVAPDEGVNFKNVPEILLGLKVYHDDEHLLATIKQQHISVLLVSPLKSEHFREQTQLVNGLIEMGVKIKMLPSEIEWDGKSDLMHQNLRDVDIEDLLPRDKIEVDMDAIGQMLHGKVVMVTGAAGSIGSEMSRQVAKFQPKRLILIDQAETPMHDIRLYMAKNHHDLDCETIVSSITNPTRMEEIFRQHCPNYVFHAAAYKHVPMMEDNPAEAIQNNVYGTRVIADLAVKYGTSKFVMISTDKAVNPTNVMGCSKRICEIYCQSLNKAIEDGKIAGVTQFVTTRFGNVLGSNGSVIPLFKSQLAQGGPLTVTHPDIIRFFMLIPEACRLVLQAGTMGNGGEIYVFDMGKPVRIADLAQRMIDLSGAKDVKIEFTGLRDGEKLYEEVLSDAEQTKPTSHPKIMVASVREYPYELALANEKALLDISYTYDDMAIVKKMKEIVPEFKSRHSKYCSLD